MSRLQARKDVQDFFWGKRDALKSLEDRFVRQKFLAEMNGIAKDLEIKAMGLADQKKEWGDVVKEAQERFDKLKKEFIARLGGDDENDPVASVPNKKTVDELKSL